ncbi:MAG: ATP-binding protein, partial [Synergistaceae bacterium]|nr:ATP-binding protein [Synergistaceae bacterium]
EKELFDLLFNALETMRNELARSQDDESGSEDYDAMVLKIENYISGTPQEPSARENKAGEASCIIHVTLDASCTMKNVRAYIVAVHVGEACGSIDVLPKDLETDAAASEYIEENGFYVICPQENKVSVLDVITEELYVENAEEVPALPQELLDACGDGSDAPESAETKQTRKPAAKTMSTGSPRALCDNIINVHLSKMDKLQDLIGELVIAESIAESAAASDGASAEHTKAAIDRLKKLTDKLRNVVVSIRMTPVSNLFQKMHKVVYDAGKKIGREVEFEVSGNDIEADKSIIDTLSDALTHVVRNAVVHGIESPEERAAAGKPPAGKITLAAKNTGNGITISISDDGRGISAEKVVSAARQRGLTINDEHAPTNDELLSIIMTPGVSTSDSVNEQSGRGVGLDVVRDAVANMKGSVALTTEEGRGTNFIISIPQTLSIMDCIALEASGSVFMMPVPDVYKIVKPNSDDLIEYPDGETKILFQGYTVPMLRMDKVMKMDKSALEFEEGIIIIIEGETCAAAIYADRLIGQKRVVIKPLPRLLSRLRLGQHGIAGCTILGDGSISLIVDAEAMLAIAQGVKR